MTTKHTPGPWGFSTEPQPNGCPIIGAHGLMVAMLAHTVNQPEQKEEALANARLIAAAPDLLEIVYRYMDVARNLGINQTLLYEDASAAFTKATGDPA